MLILDFSNSDTGIGTKDQQYKSSAFVPEAQEVESDGPKKPWWTLDYYQKYFDVDSNQVWILGYFEDFWLMCKGS